MNGSQYKYNPGIHIVFDKTHPEGKHPGGGFGDDDGYGLSGINLRKQNFVKALVI